MKLSKSLAFLVLFVIAASFVCCDEDVSENEETKESTKPEGEEAPEDEDDSDTAVKDEKGVLVLTNDNFDGVIHSNKIILVEFYAPWCGHCKSLAPEYEAAAVILKEKDPPVVLGKVDATVHTDLAQRFDVSGYPTLKFFIDGAPFEYEGPRQSAGIVDFMMEKADPSWKPPPPVALVLTTDTFTAVTEAEPLMLVEFFAPWCGHCKKLAPEYERAAKQLAKGEPPIKLATVDATVETSLAAKYDVTGYPSLKIFRYGKASEYKGGRDERGIVEYMEKQRGDGTVELKSLNALQKSLKDDDVTVVGFFKDDQSSLYVTYSDLANDKREEFKFFHLFGEAPAQRYKLAGEAILMFRAPRFETRHELKFASFDKADASTADITAFLVANQNPLVGQYSADTAQRRYKDTRPLVLMFYTVDFSFDHRKSTQMWRLKLADIANDFPGLNFAIADEDEMSDLFRKFGFDESGEELNIGILSTKDTRYPMPPSDEFDEEELREFLTKFTAGKLKPKLASQPVPKKNKGPVVVVVGKTFEKIVLDPKKDVMIELYAPWCGHCKSLAPIYKDVAKHFKSNKNIVIAKMDATVNDTPAEFSSEGFPTIYFAPAGKQGSPFKYDGGRTKEDIVKFVNENSASKQKDEL